MIPVLNFENEKSEACFDSLKRKFDESGCVLLKGFFSDQVNELKALHEDALPTYDYGKNLLEEPVTRTSEWFKEIGFFNHGGNKIRFDGVPNAHRLMRGQGPYDLKSAENAFFGKRLSMNLVQADNQFFKLLFNRDFKEITASILNTSVPSLCYHEGSMNVVFPGYPGESGMLHIDTYGFTGDDMRMSPERIKSVPFINAVVYLTEANEGCAGTRVVPGTHKKYAEINEIVSQAYGLKSGKNHIHQRELYDELFFKNSYLGKIESVEAQPGDVFIFSSNTVHGIPGNYSDQRERRVVIFNLGRAEENFGKFRTNAEKEHLKNKLDLVSLKASTLPLKADIQRKLNVITKRFSKNVKSRAKSVKAALSRKKYPATSRQILNIGAGDYFNASGWTRLDYNDDKELVGERIQRLCDVNFDLLSGEPLPFDNDTFDGIYTSHTVEHLHNEDAERIIKDCFRILKPGGVLRVVCPSIDKYFDAYDKVDLGFFNWIRNKNIYRHDSLIRLITREFAHIIVDKYSDEQLLQMYASLGRKGFIEKLSFEADASKMEFTQTLPDIHKSAWSEEKLRNLIETSGGTINSNVSRFESGIPEFRGTLNNLINSTRPHISIYCEGVKTEVKGELCI